MTTIYFDTITQPCSVPKNEQWNTCDVKMNNIIIGYLLENSMYDRDEMFISTKSSETFYRGEFELKNRVDIFNFNNQEFKHPINKN